MIKMNSISGVTYYVQDLAKTTAFYELVGFRPGEQTGEQFTVYVNWFWIRFRAQAAEHVSDGPQGEGVQVCIKVDDADEFHKHLVSKGLSPVSEPRKVQGGREFVLSDPDGYQLVFFDKK